MDLKLSFQKKRIIQNYGYIQTNYSTDTICFLTFNSFGCAKSSGQHEY